MECTIAKEFHWEMGHRLPFHNGLCKNIHGHSYKMIVEVTGTTDANGMVLDYYDLANVVSPIVQELDHSFICDDDDSVMIEFFLNNPMKVVSVPFRTTAENISQWLLERMLVKFAEFDSVNSVKIRLQETERVYAEVSAKIVRSGTLDN